MAASRDEPSMVYPPRSSMLEAELSTPTYRNRLG